VNMQETVRRMAVDNGMPCKSIARQLDVSYWVVYRHLSAAGVMRQRSHLSEETRRTIESLIRLGESSYASIARQFTINKTTVMKIARKMAEADAISEGDEQWSPDNPLQELDFKPISFRRATYCEKCRRLINVVPCVACAAKEAAFAKSNAVDH
jgi:hypothetical protein